MLNALGKGLILVGMAVLGLQLAASLRRRATCLSEFLTALERLERELAFALPPVEDLLARMREGGHGAAKRFFAACEEAFLQRGEERLEEIWTQELEDGVLPLEQEDRMLLQEIGGILGRYDGDSQRLALKRIHGRLEESIRCAKEEAERMGKVYGTLGVTVGIFCIILL